MPNRLFRQRRLLSYSHKSLVICNKCFIFFWVMHFKTKPPIFISVNIIKYNFFPVISKTIPYIFLIPTFPLHFIGSFLFKCYPLDLYLLYNRCVPIVNTKNRNRSKKSKILRIYFIERKTMITCYIMKPHPKRILKSQYQPDHLNRYSLL